MGWWLARLALLVWFGLSLALSITDLRGATLRSGQPVSAAVAFFIALPVALIGTLTALTAVLLSRRRPVSSERIAAGATLHISAAIAFGAANLLARIVERMLLGSTGYELSSARDLHDPVNVALVYLVITGLAHATEYARRYRQKQLAELQLRAELAHAELQRTAAELRMLKMQLNPHFLFNSLHAVSTLVPREPATAQRVVVRLADLLRRAMHGVATQEVALEEEIAGLRPFVEIEQIRLGGGLAVDWQVADETLDALVPHMILQPLVENAIKHGILPAGGQGGISVGARRQGDWLELTVRDDGAGLSPATPARAEQSDGGVGSANVRSRLAQLYGTGHHFELRAVDGGGTLATLHIPWHESPAERHAPPPVPAK
jgi:sensor histidine kinase YesM